MLPASSRSSIAATAGVAARRLMGVSNNSNAAIGATRFMSKEIKFGVDGRAAMLRGVNLLADAVQVSYI